MRIVSIAVISTLLFLGIASLIVRAAWTDTSELRALTYGLPILAGVIGIASAVGSKIASDRIGALKAPRTLGDTRDRFVAALQLVSNGRPPPSVSVGYDPRAFDGKVFASEIAEAFREAGWGAGEPAPVDVGIRKPGVDAERDFQGIRLIRYAGPNSMLAEQFNARRRALIDALGFLQEPRQVVFNCSQDDSMMGTLIIGRRSREYPYEGSPTYVSEDERFEPKE